MDVVQVLPCHSAPPFLDKVLSGEGWGGFRHSLKLAFCQEGKRRPGPTPGLVVARLPVVWPLGRLSDPPKLFFFFNLWQRTVISILCDSNICKFLSIIPGPDNRRHYQYLLRSDVRKISKLLMLNPGPAEDLMQDFNLSSLFQRERFFFYYRLLY